MRAQIVTLITVAALGFLWPASAYAKRKSPVPVPSVVSQGIEYRAPLDVEHMGHVQAFDMSTGRMLWETKVYHVWINPLVETDVQWVFVSGMKLQDGELMVRNEDGRTYRLDLMTGRVEGGMRSWFLWFLAGCFVIGLAFLAWIRKGRDQNGPANGSLPVVRG